MLLNRTKQIAELKLENQLLIKKIAVPQRQTNLIVIKTKYFIFGFSVAIITFTTYKLIDK